MDHTASPLSPAEFAAFHRDGVLVLRGSLAGERLDHLRSSAMEIRRQAEAGGWGGVRIAPGFEERVGAAGVPPWTEMTWGIGEITRPGLHDPTLINALAEPRLHGALTSLLAEPRAWGQKILWAPRGVDYDLFWHRDINTEFDPVMPYKPAGIQDHIQLNAALEKDSAFIVVPGSHRRRMTAVERATIDADRHAKLPGEIRIELEPGDVLLMDAHALHRGSLPAGHPRLTLHFSLQAQWVPLKPWGDAQSFAWLTGAGFIDGLDPTIREWYRRLTTANKDTHQYTYLVEQARRAGWTPDPGWRMPGTDPYQGSKKKRDASAAPTSPAITNHG
ncbi:hypothetical protein LBMAG53_28990 [Planctomycetota bacterium]|nr:hypothetical protein LBMAG53_28990 [Planctomycetota bacterium]